MWQAIKRPLFPGGLALLGLIAIWRCFFTVDETEWVIILRFGKPVRVIKEAGLHLKLPFDTVRRFDKRLRLYDPPPSEFLTGDKKNLLLDAYVCWRLADPIKFLQSVGDFVGAEARLHDLVWSELSAALGRFELSDLLSTEPEGVKIDRLLGTVLRHCRTVALTHYGIAVVDIRLKRLNFPTQNRESVFARMRAERERIAKRYRAEGEEEAMRIKAEADREKERILAEARREAEQIKGRADAEAARIYGEAFSKDPKLYHFLRTLEAYRKAMDEKTTLVLSSDSEFLRLLTQRREEEKGSGKGGQ